MSVMMLRAAVKAESVDEVEAAAKAMFAALDRDQPQGIRYASAKLADGVTFVILLQVDEGIENPLPAVPEFQEFQASLPGWLAGPPTPEQLTLVGSYNLF
jgi:hypothetical protein